MPKNPKTLTEPTELESPGISEIASISAINEFSDLDCFEKARLAKNEAIRAGRKKTKERRTNQVCKVYELKLVANKISKSKKEIVNQTFKEAPDFSPG